jgi:hypothetical protein
MQNENMKNVLLSNIDLAGDISFDRNGRWWFSY